MNAKERHFWDVTGYLVIKNVLSTEELSAANEAIDYCADRIGQAEDNKGAGESTFLRGTGPRCYTERICSTSIHPTAIHSAECWFIPRWLVG